jgi:hypothetical protein
MAGDVADAGLCGEVAIPTIQHLVREDPLADCNRTPASVILGAKCEPSEAEPVA